MISWMIVPDLERTSVNSIHSKQESAYSSGATVDYQLNGNVGLSKYMQMIKTLARANKKETEWDLLERTIFMLVIHIQDWSATVPSSHFENIKNYVLKQLISLPKVHQCIEKSIAQISDLNVK